MQLSFNWNSYLCLGCLWFYLDQNYAVRTNIKFHLFDVSRHNIRLQSFQLVKAVHFLRSKTSIVGENGSSLKFLNRKKRKLARMQFNNSCFPLLNMNKPFLSRLKNLKIRDRLPNDKTDCWPILNLQSDILIFQLTFNFELSKWCLCGKDDAIFVINCKSGWSMILKKSNPGWVRRFKINGRCLSFQDGKMVLIALS